MSRQETQWEQWWSRERSMFETPKQEGNHGSQSLRKRRPHTLPKGLVAAGGALGVVSREPV